ncbi:hypothetical protein ACP70R_042185 [Stipagrostis hirtigluma subsp. patula]
MAEIGYGDGDGDGKKSTTFRWLDVVRYAVAAVVTVLIVAVIANAITVVLRPDSLYLTVVRGSMLSTRLPPTAAAVPTVTVDLNLRGQNPSGRARMYFINITAYVFDNSTSPWTSKDPMYDSIFFFKIPGGKDVPQQQAADSFLHANMTEKAVTPPYFDIMYNGSSIIDGVTMRLDGKLVTEVTVNRTRPTTYYCGPLLIVGDPDAEAFKKKQDVLCREMQGRHFVQ